MLDDGATTHHVDKLTAVTNSEHRHFRIDRGEKFFLALESFFGDGFGFRMIRFAPIACVDIVSAGDEETIEGFGERGRIGLRRNEHGNTTGIGDDLRVVPVKRKLAPRARVFEIAGDVNRYTDEGLHLMRVEGKDHAVTRVEMVSTFFFT